MERKITGRMEEWKGDPNHKPLILTGCRQVGKTYSALEFATTHYRSYVYIDFERDPEKKLLFEGSLEYDDLIPKLSFSEKVGLVKGESVIVLDGIQECLNAFSALKPLSLSGGIDVIALCPSLDFDPDSDTWISPLGYVNIERMHPMDFEEYLWAMGVDKGLVQMIGDDIRNRTAVDEYLNRAMTDHYRRFMVVGGMPAAVRAYSETNDYTRASEALDGIIAI